MTPAEIVASVGRGEAAGELELYRLICCQRKRLSPEWRADLDDACNDLWLIVRQGIVEQRLQCPEALLGYIYGASRTMRWNEARAKKRFRRYTELQPRKGYAPAHEDATQERLMAHGMSRLHPLHRQLIERFYLLEQPAEQIQGELSLSASRFRVEKSRAKARLTQAVAMAHA